MPLRTAFALAALAAACSFAAPVSSAAGLPMSLVGEMFVAGPTNLFSDVVTDETCPTNMTFHVYADGPAAGPYTGTFTEDAYVTVNDAGSVTALTATFTIAADDGTMISGSKHFVPGGGTGTCEGDPNGFHAVVHSAVSYDAQIETADGTFEDTGTAHVDSDTLGTIGFAPVLGSLRIDGTFTESFLTSNGVVSAATTGHVTGGGWILDAATLHRVSFGFEAKTMPDGWHGTCTVIDHTTKEHVHCLTVDSLVVAGTHATFTGTATVNGVPTDYRIDVNDLGEPAAPAGDTFAIVTAPYTAGGPLGGGNIQIHMT